MKTVKTCCLGIELAALATLGPTHAVLDRGGDVIVLSVMVTDPDGPHREQDAIVRWPFRQLAANLSRHPVTREVLDFAAITR